MIPAITLIRPMSAAIVWGSKDIENRPRDLPKKMKGVKTIVAVHAGKKWDVNYLQAIERIDGEGSYDCPALSYRERLQDQGLVGLMLLSGRVYTDQCLPCVVHADGAPRLSQWYFGPYGYEIIAKAPLKEPLPCKGALGFWPVPEELELMIRDSAAWRHLSQHAAYIDRPG